MNKLGTKYIFVLPRFMCNPGLGFKAPAEARIGNYIDKKCPFTGKVPFKDFGGTY